MELQCVKCKFQYDSFRIPQLCPNCGAKGTISQVPTATELLSEAIIDEEKLKDIKERKEEWKKRLKSA